MGRPRRQDRLGLASDLVGTDEVDLGFVVQHLVVSYQRLPRLQ